MSNQTLICRDCGSSFPFTVEEKEFYEEKGFSAPNVCRACRSAKKDERRTVTEMACEGCGQKIAVPWKGGRLIYCSGCFEKRERLSVDPFSIDEDKTDSEKPSAILIDFNEDLKRYFAKQPEKLYDLSPRKFEELIADILSDFGFNVELTPATRDGGKDIYAYIKNQICSFLMFVECKKWVPAQHVGIEVVQRLYGVQQINKSNKSLIVTTSFFTKPAIEECKRYETLMDLRDYNDLKTWLKRYDET